jgi:hypothetical protein
MEALRDLSAVAAFLADELAANPSPSAVRR